MLFLFCRKEYSNLLLFARAKFERASSKVEDLEASLKKEENKETKS